MSKGIVIDVHFNTRGQGAKLQRLRKDLDDLAISARKAAAAQKQYNASGPSGGGGGGARGGGASRGGGGGSSTPARRTPSGPAARMQQAQEDFRAALVSGNPTAVFDARHRLRTATQAYQRSYQANMPGRDPQSPFMQALMRTRFVSGANGIMKAMPLGRDLMQFGAGAFGLGGGAGGAGGAAGGTAIRAALMNPYVLAAVAAVATVAIPIALARMSAGAVGAQRRGFATFGGTNGSLTAQNIFGRAFGGDGRQLQYGIESGIGAAYAIQAGINPLGGPFGDMDYASKFKRASQFVMNAPSFDEARRRSEAFGMPEMAQSFFLSPEKKEEYRRMMGERMNPDNMRKSADFDFEAAKVAESMERLRRSFIGFAPLITNVASITERLVSAGAVLTQQHPMVRLINRMAELFGGSSQTPETREADSRERHTKAMDDHTREMKRHREVLGSRGDNAARAIPSGVRGTNAAEAQDSVRVRLV